MDISVWKKMGGVALAAALLLAPLAGDASAKNKNKARRQAQQEQTTADTQVASPAPPQLPAAPQVAPAAYDGAAPPVPPSSNSPQPAPQAAAPQAAVPQATPLPENGPYPTTNNGYVYDDEYCDDGSGHMCFRDRMSYCNNCFKCWKMNHCPWCRYGEGSRFHGSGWNGEGSRFVGSGWNFKHKGIYPADINYFDTRDIQVYSNQGTGVPMSMPLAPVVRYAYNDGWGVPASRITTVGSTYNRWYPQEFHAFAQKNTPAPVGPDGKPLPQPISVPPSVYWKTDTTQHGVYYKHVPQWQPAQRTRWSNIPQTIGVQAPAHQSANLTPYPMQQPALGTPPAAPVAPRGN